jgi:hypothetical protein
MDRLEICDYEDCTEKPAESEMKNTDSEMRFCDKHLAEINGLIDSENVKGVLKFWIMANGGPKAMAQKMLHGPVGVHRSHRMAGDKSG